MRSRRPSARSRSPPSASAPSSAPASSPSLAPPSAATPPRSPPGQTPHVLDLLIGWLHHTSGAVAGRPGAGPALVVSLVLVAIVCALTGLCYAELASMIPIAGSAYTYTYATLGELIAWIIGWDLILEYAFSNMSVSVGFAAHLVDLLDWLGLHLEPQMALALLPAARSAGSRRPRHLHTRLALGLQHPRLPHRPSAHRRARARHPRVRPHQQHHGARQDRRHPGLLLRRPLLHSPRQLPSVRRPTASPASSPAAPSSFSPTSASTPSPPPAEECKNPQRDVPIGIIATLIVCTVLYIGVAAVFTGLVPWRSVAGDSAPVVNALKRALAAARRTLACTGCGSPCSSVPSSA